MRGCANPSLAVARLTPTDTAIHALLDLPLLRGIEPSTRACLLESARFQSFEPGENITEMGAEGEELYLLVKGEMAVTRAKRLVTLTAAPNVLGLVSIVDGRSRSASLSAFSRTELFALDRAAFDRLVAASPVLSRNLVLYLATDIRQLYERQDTLMRHFDDFFESPNARLVPGPYYGELFDQYIFIMEDLPATLLRLMPPGCTLLPGLGGRYLITFNFFPGLTTRNPAGRGKKFAYAETAPFIPCVVSAGRSGLPSTAGLFCPELYPDNYLAIALGRELYGFPKRFATTTCTSDHVDMVMGGRMILRASWQDQQSITADRFAADCLRQMLGEKGIAQLLAPLQGAFFSLVNRDSVRAHWPAMPVFVHKQIPDVVSENEVVYEIDELDEVPFKVMGLSDFRVLHGAGVRFLTDDWFLGGRCLGAFRLRMSFGFGKGREWINYRDRNARPSRSFLSRLLPGRRP